MKSEEAVKFIQEIEARCAKEIERIEGNLGREFTLIEKNAFECAYMLGHAAGQEYAKRLFQTI